MRSKADVICSRNVLIVKCVIADWLADVGREQKTTAIDNIIILSWETCDLRYFVWEGTGRVIID